MIGFSSACPWAHTKRGILQVWENLIGSLILIMVDPPANTTTTPIKISQTYQFPRLACAHGHNTLDKPFIYISEIDTDFVQCEFLLGGYRSVKFSLATYKDHEPLGVVLRLPKNLRK